MKRSVFLLGLLLSASAFAWVDDSVAIKGTLESVTERYVDLKTPNHSIIRIPKHESDTIVYGRPVVLKRSLAELSEIKTLQHSRGTKKSSVHDAVEVLDYKAIQAQYAEILKHQPQR